MKHATAYCPVCGDLMAEEADKRVEELERLLQSIIADVEAMHDEKDWFGQFDAETFTPGKAYVYWPNLAILLAEAKQKMEGKHEHRNN